SRSRIARPQVLLRREQTTGLLFASQQSLGMFCGEPAAVFRYADGNHFVFLLIDCIQNGRCRQQRHFMLAAASAKKDANPKLCHIISFPGTYSFTSQSIASSRVLKV